MSDSSLLLAELQTAGGLAAVAVAAIVYFLQERTRKTGITIDLWKVWSSKDYRRYRVKANNSLKEARTKSKLPPLKDILKDEEAEEAIGTIEHFVAEMAEIKRRGLISQRLFEAIFLRSLIQWRDILAPYNRTGADAHDWVELDAAFCILLGKHYARKSDFHLGFGPAPVVSNGETVALPTSDL